MPVRQRAGWEGGEMQLPPPLRHREKGSGWTNCPCSWASGLVQCGFTLALQVPSMCPWPGVFLGTSVPALGKAASRAPPRPSLQPTRILIQGRESEAGVFQLRCTSSLPGCPQAAVAPEVGRASEWRGPPLRPLPLAAFAGPGSLLPQAMKVLSKKKLIRQAGFPRACGLGQDRAH